MRREYQFAGGEKVSHGFLAPIFQVRILAREPNEKLLDLSLGESRLMSSSESDSSRSIVILAAGAGTRMKSRHPKPLHPVAGRPMLEHVRSVARSLDPVDITIVGSPELRRRLASATWANDVTFAIQDPPRGTGDAVRKALESGSAGSTVLVLYADHPLVTAEVLSRLLDAFDPAVSHVAVMTCVVEDAAGYGRIDRDAGGQVRAIVEQVDDDPRLRTGRIEINSGVMALSRQWAADALRRLEPNPRKNEYFLTDLVEMAALESPGSAIGVEGESEILVGINDRMELAAADALLRSRVRRNLMENGVTLIAPETNLIDSDVTIGIDTTVGPGCILEAGTRIGEGCVIGPHAVLRSAIVGDRVRIESSTIESAVVGSDSDVGPYTHIRDGVEIGERVHIGNFAELKNARIGNESRVGHFSYIGDATLGADVNIGAGTVTCNFDGVEKHLTMIGSGAFIGSDTLLIAPVSVGEGARTGAGAVVTRNVAEGATVVGMPARHIRREMKKPIEPEPEGAQ